MADTYREVKETTVRDNDTVPEETVPADTVQRKSRVTTNDNTAGRIISLIGGVIMAILGMRFVLSLLGANRENAFADFIYSISHPFASPFFGLFNYTPEFGVVRFEFETLIAIAFWGFITWLIIQMVNIGQHRE